MRKNISGNYLLLSHIFIHNPFREGEKSPEPPTLVMTRKSTLQQQPMTAKVTEDRR